MKKVVLSLLTVGMILCGFSSFYSASSLEPNKVVLEENPEVNGVETASKTRAVVEGVKFWGKEALKMFFNNGGMGSPGKDEYVATKDLESAFDN
ncbi:hypothetical protein VL07_17980 [Bacillus safensis]|uniref:hypothetical protein n=1 Tax=Bacillus TaxID=1386 RepID=UPI000650BB06|nr:MULTISPECIES: hypothetical protein [Bacillus]KML08816.1 hypothetical protein VL07_17980 [Bacillus safensis]KML48284.1 hypothetical protein VL18_16580 [Bacillus safensis]KMN76954.1 hypothetical protein VK99_17075 [Bacillus safensis]MCY7676848.1 hypothetical protein [Bacillus safensis]MCY7696523.1 hypothetical protein [Bacillus safensis]